MIKKIGIIFFGIILAIVLINVIYWECFDRKLVTEKIEHGNDKTLVVAPEENNRGVTFLAVGDVMLARKLNLLINRYGINYPFAYVNEFLTSADIAFTNLESPISLRGQKLPGKGIWFRGETKNMEALKNAGFDVVSVANNHALDYDSPALLDTIESLVNAGIQPVGAGKDIVEARKPGIIDKKDIKVAFLAYSEMADIVWSYKYPRRLGATNSLPGIAPLNLEEMLDDLAQIRSNVDIVVVSLHWGVEYQHHPEDYQREIAYKLIDAGANVIIGHHPHCIQGVELYKNGLIAYSLGNFVFDQNWSEKTKQGLVLRLTLTPSQWKNAELSAVYINDGQPMIIEGDKGDNILNFVQDISGKLGTNIEVKNGKALIKSGSREEGNGL